MSLIRTALVSAIVTLSISLPLSYMAYKKAISAPISFPLIIFDVSSYVKRIDINDPNYKEQAKIYGEMAKTQIQMLKKQGFIVLDSNSILDAPEGYYANGQPNLK